MTRASLPVLTPSTPPADEPRPRTPAARGRPSTPAARRGLRRATSVVAVLALLGIGVAAALGRGAHPWALRLADGGGWLPSERLGLLFHVNGPSGLADAVITLPGAAGHHLAVLTDVASPAAATAGAAARAEGVIVVDGTSGAAWRIDASLLTITATAAFPPGTVVTAAGGVAYAVDAAGGQLVGLDPGSLAQAGPPVTFPRGLGSPAQTADTTLWVPVPSAGTVVPVRAGVPAAPIAVAPAGDRIDALEVAGQPVVLDRTARSLTRPAGGGAPPLLRLPSADGADGTGLLVAPRTEGQVVALVDTAAGDLVLADLATGQVRATDLPSTASTGAGLPTLAGGAAGTGARRLGAPLWQSGRVYVPDSDAGVVWVYNPETGRYETPVQVTRPGGPAPITAAIQGGQLWVNDTSGPGGMLVDGGHRRDILKFGQSLPGGDSTASPKPLPPGAATGPTTPIAAGRGGAGDSRSGQPIWPGWGRGGDHGQGRFGHGSGGDGTARHDGGPGGTGTLPRHPTGTRPGTAGPGERPTGEPTVSPTAPPPGPSGVATTGEPSVPPGTPSGTGGTTPGVLDGGQLPRAVTAPARPAATPEPAAATSPNAVTTPTAAPGRAPAPPAAHAPPPPGYWLLTSAGTVLGRGAAGTVDAGAASAGAVAVVPSATGHGYWLVGADGAGRPAGDATAVPAVSSPGTVVAAAAGPTGGGYWTVTGAGTVAAHGSLADYGSLGAEPPAPVVGIAATPTGGGYWLADAAGGAHPFGDAARIAAGTGGMGPASGSGRTVAIAASPSGSGYWTVTAAGTVTAHGRAANLGSLASAPTAVVGLAVTPTGRGYWVIDAAGGARPFGDAVAFGDPVPAGTRVVAAAGTP